MVSALDQRIVRLGLQIDGQITYFDGGDPENGFDINASGRKSLSASMSQCDVRISNLTKFNRNYILTRASPLIQPKRERQAMLVTLDVGRQSYGTFRLFEGYSYGCLATQPPDIGIVLQSLTNNLFNGLINSYAQSSVSSLRRICQQIAASMTNPQYPSGLQLDFQATEKNISNYSFTGAAIHQLEKLNEMGGIQATIDNGKLIVIDANKARAGGARVINQETGMIGIPSVSDNGVTVKMLIDNSIELGGSVKIESDINPAANGTYKVNQINFELASRATPFYYTLLCSNLVYIQGTS